VGGATSNRFMQLIRRNSHFNSIALIGHAPDVNTFSLGLIKNNMKQMNMNFKNSSVCKISYDAEKEAGKFEWFLDADSMKLMTS
jgi:phosphohistidine phosphatase SixA